MKYFVFLISLMATLLTSNASDFKFSSLLEGSTLKLYNGTGDTAVTWAYNDSFATNRTFIPVAGSTAVYPLSTNANNTSIIYPSFNRDVPIWPDRNGGMTTNAAISVTYSANAATTSALTLTFIRSCDGGTNYDTGSAFAFAITPGTTALTTTTNFPQAFLLGASHIRFQKAVLAGNATDDAQVTLSNIGVGGWIP